MPQVTFFKLNRLNLLIALFLGVLISAIAIPALSSPKIVDAICGTSCTYTDAWGTQEVPGSSWMGGGGVPIFSNGSLAPGGPSPDTYNYVNNASNQSTQTGIEWQCVELVNRLYITKGWTTSTWSGNGDQLYGNASNVGLTKEAQGSITSISLGDVIGMSKSGTPGHVAVISGVSGTSITIASQNTNSVYDSSFALNRGSVTMSGWSGYTIQGIIHHPNSTPFAFQSFMGDFNGDNLADVGLRNPTTGTFFARYGSGYGSQTAFTWDNSLTNFQSFMGDFNGDHIVDVGLRNPNTGTFYVRYGPDFTSQTAFTWDNSANFQSFAGDYNGDHIVDFGLRNPNTGTFYIRYGPSYTAQTAFTWDNSLSTYQSFVGDYNGDNVVDVGLRNPITGTFYVRYGPSFTSQTAFTWDNSVSNLQGFIGDYNGDHVVDVGLRNPGTGIFFTRYGSSYTSQTSFAWDHD